MQHPRSIATRRVAAAKLRVPWVNAEAAAAEASNPATWGATASGVPSNDALASTIKAQILRAEQGSRSVRRRSARPKSIRLQPGHSTMRRRSSAAGHVADHGQQQPAARTSARATAVSFAADVREFRRAVGVHDEVRYQCGLRRMHFMPPHALAIVYSACTIMCPLHIKRRYTLMHKGML